MTKKEKWIEYRRILRVIYSSCWDCPRPCSICQQWARETAFGRTPTGRYADACADTYRIVTEMNRRGISILIGELPDERKEA